MDCNLAQANIENGDQLLQLTVDADADDSYAQSDLDEDPDFDDQDRDTSYSEAENEEMVQPQVTRADTRARLDEIDNEMSEKILELKKMIDQGGLSNLKRIF